MTRWFEIGDHYLNSCSFIEAPKSTPKHKATKLPVSMVKKVLNKLPA